MPWSWPVQMRGVPWGRSGKELGNLPPGSLRFLFLQVWASFAKLQHILSYCCASYEGWEAEGSSGLLPLCHPVYQTCWCSAQFPLMFLHPAEMLNGGVKIPPGWQRCLTLSSVGSLRVTMVRGKGEFASGLLK